MNSVSLCPVPKEQRPLKEFCQLKESWFFSWPINSQNKLNEALFKSWLIILPVNILISTGSLTVKDDPVKLLLLSITISFGMPLILLVRQLLGWKYIRERLKSTIIEYEESGWYDGQAWEKPLMWRNQDLLIVQHDINPIINRLMKSLSLTSLFLITGICLCQSF